MKFYQENKVNPLGSCLPLVAPVPGLHLAVLHAAHGPQGRHLPGHHGVRGRTQTSSRTSRARVHGDPLSDARGPGSGPQFLFIPDLTGKATGAVLVVLIVLYVGSQLGSSLLMSSTADKNQRRIFLALPLVFVDLHHQLPGRPDRLLDHHQHLDDRAAVDRAQDGRPDPTGDAARLEFGSGRRRTPSSGGGGLLDRIRESVPAGCWARAPTCGAQRQGGQEAREGRCEGGRGREAIDDVPAPAAREGREQRQGRLLRRPDGGVRGTKKGRRAPTEIRPQRSHRRLRAQEEEALRAAALMAPGPEESSRSCSTASSRRSG